MKVDPDFARQTLLQEFQCGSIVLSANAEIEIAVVPQTRVGTKTSNGPALNYQRHQPGAVQGAKNLRDIIFMHCRLEGLLFIYLEKLFVRLRLAGATKAPPNQSCCSRLEQDGRDFLQFNWRELDRTRL